MLGLMLKIRSWFSKEMHVINTQTINIVDPFNDEDNIIDLGGGGEGIIGILRGNQVTAIDIREDELDETPEGPIKVVADARELPFEESSFSACSAFFFLMYVEKVDREKVLKESYRVLKPGGKLFVWDVIISSPKKKIRKLFVVPLKIKIDGRKIHTAYGTRWDSKFMSCTEIIDIAEKIGFKTISRNIDNSTFYIELIK